MYILTTLCIIVYQSTCRSKRLAPVLIKEITRRVNLTGRWQAAYTAGVSPTAVHTPLQPNPPTCHIFPVVLLSLLILILMLPLPQAFCSQNQWASAVTGTDL